MILNLISTVATLISTVAYVVTIYYLQKQMHGLEKDRYINVTNELFSIWQSREFMQDQLWLLHQLHETTWEAFVLGHRADSGEVAFHRVGSFYDRVGTLVELGMINESEILSTMGGYAIAVWTKIEPLVREARGIEHSTLFDNFERLLPSCYECYVPSLKGSAAVEPFSVPPRPKTGRSDGVETIEVDDLKRRLTGSAPPLVIDTRGSEQVARQPEVIPGAQLMTPEAVGGSLSQFSREREVVFYCA